MENAERWGQASLQGPREANLRVEGEWGTTAGGDKARTRLNVRFRSFVLAW